MKERIQQLLSLLNSGLYEKEEAMKLALLSAIAGESIFLLGSPGVAKSLIARRLKLAFQGANSFEYLMNRFSTPDEIFGPVSISKLKEDKYERLTEGYLTEADIVFLDEIWKAGPSIQNALLTVLNEKVYRNGAQEVAVKMKGLIAASNELPAANEGLEALWDRFLMRYYVEGIQNGDTFLEMITTKKCVSKVEVATEITISDSEMEKWNAEINEIEIPKEVQYTIQMIRHYISEHSKVETNESIYISDRRWKKIIRLLRTAAFLNERKKVDLMDCFLIAHCLWHEASQIELVKEWVSKAIREHGYKLGLNIATIKSELEELKAEVKSETSAEKTIIKKERKVIDGKYYEIGGVADKYNRMLISDFNKLHIGNWTYIYLYDNRNDSSNQIRAMKTTKDDVVSLYSDYYSSYYGRLSGEYNLVLSDKQEIEKITKRANEKIMKVWNIQINDFLAVCANAIEKIEQHKTNDLAHLKTNLFVPADLAHLVEQNLNASIREFDSLKLEIKQVKAKYDAIK